MNEELEAAKKKIREGVVAYVRAAYKASGSAEIAVLMLAKEISGIGDSLTEADFAWLEEKGGEA
jgi:hypothetical protein